ncbi:MAG: hypothetical protein PGN07_03840 [Aeromicrobium erythreum]
MTTVLLWGGPDDEALLDGLPPQDVLVADWTPGPGAREALLRSFAIARGDGIGRDVALVGVGLGATAAVSLLLHQRRLGLDLGQVVAVETAWDLDDPISGHPLPEPGPAVPTTRVDLLGDDPATTEHADAWRDLGWEVRRHPTVTSVAELVRR